MSTQRIYALPVEITDWKFDGATDIQFNWEYDDGSDALLELYEKGKKQQWDASTRLDWSLELNPDNPMELKDEAISIYGTDYWRKMTEKERSWLRRNLQANSISQFMHGEQGALIATAKIVATVPDMNAKFYAATQVMDEARHVEAYKRLLHEKFELAYPINKALKTLLEQTLTDRRWDMTYLGMQVLIEGLALAAFQSIRDKSGNTLAGAVNAYVMQDEARHVSFGRLALREYYPQLSDGRARRARGVRGRGALFHARPLQPVGSLGAARPAGQGAGRHPLQFQADEFLPRPAVQPRRADGEGHRPVGRAGAARPSARWA